MEDTSKQGFEKLWTALKRYYPDFKYGDDVTLIYFDLAK